MGSPAILNEPSPFDWAVTSRFVAVLRALMETPCTTPPLLSVTSPSIEPSVCCAKEGTAKHAEKIRNVTAYSTHFCLFILRPQDIFHPRRRLVNRIRIECQG